MGGHLANDVLKLQLGLFFFMVALLLPAPSYPFLFTEHCGFKPSQYGLLVGLSALGHLCASLVYGNASDRLGRKPVMLFQTMSSGALYVLLGCGSLSPASPKQTRVCTLCYLALGCTNTLSMLTLSSICDLCLSSTSLARHKSKLIAQTTGIIALGGAVGPPLGQLLSPVPPYFPAATCCFVACGIAFFSNETIQVVSKLPSRMLQPLRDDVKVDFPVLDVAVLCLSQAVKALAISVISGCYALVLAGTIPNGWLFDLSNESLVALGLFVVCSWRVVVQLFLYERILSVLKGPAGALFVGTLLLSMGLAAVYATLPQVNAQALNETSKLWQIFVHFAVGGGLLITGMSLVEPAIIALVAYAVEDFPDRQGLSQSFQSASNLLGASLGPPIFGSVLTTSKSRPFYLAAAVALVPLLFTPRLRRIEARARKWDGLSMDKEKSLQYH